MSLRHWTLGDWWLTAMALYALILTLAAWAWSRYRYGVGKHDGKCAEQERQGRKRDSKILHAPWDGPEIRAKTGPLPAGAPRQDQDFRRGRKTGGGLPGPPPTTQPRQRGPQRIVTTAADIAPVIYPHGAAEVPLRPQPASEPGRHTAAMDRLTDTGWMRAIEAGTNEYIHAMHEDSARYDRLRAQDAAHLRPEGPAPAPASGAGPLPPDPGRWLP